MAFDQRYVALFLRVVLPSEVPYFDHAVDRPDRNVLGIMRKCAGSERRWFGIWVEIVLNQFIFRFVGSHKYDFTVLTTTSDDFTVVVDADRVDDSAVRRVGTDGLTRL